MASLCRLTRFIVSELAACHRHLQGRVSAREEGGPSGPAAPHDGTGDEESTFSTGILTESRLLIRPTPRPTDRWEERRGGDFGRFEVDLIYQKTRFDLVLYKIG